MYTYAQVESALARVHHIPDSSLGSFRGRIKHFQRIGIVPQSPGKGKKISYEKTDVYNWTIGLEFAEFGLDPTVIKPFIEAHGHFIQRYLDDCPDKYLFFYPRFLGKSFPNAEQTTSYTLTGGIADPILAKVIGDISELDQLATNAMARDTVARLKVRYGMINLGHLRREVESALMFVSA